MGSVLSYSGLSTKIRAMQSRLTTLEQFEEILQLSDVTQVAAYLSECRNTLPNGMHWMKIPCTEVRLRNF